MSDNTKAGPKAVESVKSICRSFKFRIACKPAAAGKPVIVLNHPYEPAQQQLQEMGELVGKMAVDG